NAWIPSPSVRAGQRFMITLKETARATRTIMRVLTLIDGNLTNDYTNHANSVSARCQGADNDGYLRHFQFANIQLTDDSDDTIVEPGSNIDSDTGSICITSTRMERWKKTEYRSWSEKGYDANQFNPRYPPVLHEKDKKDGGDNVRCTLLLLHLQLRRTYRQGGRRYGDLHAGRRRSPSSPDVPLPVQARRRVLTCVSSLGWLSHSTRHNLPSPVILRKHSIIPRLGPRDDGLPTIAPTRRSTRLQRHSRSDTGAEAEAAAAAEDPRGCRGSRGSETGQSHVDENAREGPSVKHEDDTAPIVGAATAERERKPKVEPDVPNRFSDRVTLAT
ncbi:hypothetical protein BD310DRAFT_804752, partial [Dichomitus squalens]